MFSVRSKALLSSSLFAQTNSSTPPTQLSRSGTLFSQNPCRFVQCRSVATVVSSSLQGQETATVAECKELSPKERRKLRNERREELKGKKGSWKEDVETKLDVKKKAPKGWEEILDINRLATKGYQWWMLSVPKNGEKVAADQVDVVFPERFPGVKYEVLSPSIPARKKLKDGRYSDARQRLYPGCLFVRCVLTREVYDVLRSNPRVRDFYGTKANTSVSDMIIPAAVSIVEMDDLFRRIEKEEAEFKILKEAVDREVDEKEKLEREVLAKAEIEVIPPPKLEEGALVQVNSGPFINHTGIIVDINDEDETAKVMVTVFGKETAAMMRLDQLLVLEGAS